MIDPPCGWQYGFPKPIPDGYLKNETLMRVWLEGEGYPSSLVDLALTHSRYWESDIESDQPNLI